MNSESLQSFEDKSPQHVRLNANFDGASVLQAIPKEWQHVIIVDEFLIPVPPNHGHTRVCEVMGLDQIGDTIDGPPCFVRIGSLRQRFEQNMSRPQAKKIMILALGCKQKLRSHPSRPDVVEDIENIPPGQLLDI